MSRRLRLISRFGLMGCIVLGFVAGVARGGSASALGTTLTSGGYGRVNSISCPAPGYCAAAGYYVHHHHPRAFVVSEANGIWGKPVKVPGTATRSHAGGSSVLSISCAAPGECAAGGYWVGTHRARSFIHNGSPRTQAFVVDETNGRWGRAIPVPGMATLNRGEVARVESISCAAVGDCAASGFYVDGNGNWRGFVVSETNGRWGKAVRRGPWTSGDFVVSVDSVSCSGAGDCTAAGGHYDLDGSRTTNFIVKETNGHWGHASEVAGLETLNPDGSVGVPVISCAAPGDCAAGGQYGVDFPQAFVVDKANGNWGNAVDVPGMATLNSGLDAGVSSISCGSPGDCAAGGYYTDERSHRQAFVVSEAKGSWGAAVEVPGTGTLNTGGHAELVAISCAAAGECGAGGFSDDGSGRQQAFVTSETAGVWGNAITVPGAASVRSISCAAAGECAAGGVFLSRGSARFRAYVVDETNGSWDNSIHVLRFPA